MPAQVTLSFELVFMRPLLWVHELRIRVQHCDTQFGSNSRTRIPSWTSKLASGNPNHELNRTLGPVQGKALLLTFPQASQAICPPGDL